MGSVAAVQQLHERCAVYTSRPTASRLLDLCGWTAAADLSGATLLEPCAGEGAILLEAIARLLASLRSHGHTLTKARLRPRIKAFEIHPRTARTARKAVNLLLLREGLSWTVANEVSEAWLREADFLLAGASEVTHVACNPPYVRWGKLPEELAATYRQALPELATRGDLAVAFLHRIQQWSTARSAKVSALVSDRWMYAQYGDPFVRNTIAAGWTIAVADERPDDPFVRSVGAYSCIVVMSRKGKAAVPRPHARESARRLHEKLVERHGTMGSAGCIVRVGPALGAGRAFLLEPGQDAPVEHELVRPFLGKEDLVDGGTVLSGRRVILPWTSEGRPIKLEEWPLFEAWAQKRRDLLEARSQFVGSPHWWRTIDAVPAIWNRKPKLLLPELCKKPAVSIDRTGAVPAHSLYAVWSESWPTETLAAVLNAGLLELTARSEAPTLKLGWLRFYKRFLMRTPLPRWEALDRSTRNALFEFGSDFAGAFESLFGFPAGAVPER